MPLVRHWNQSNLNIEDSALSILSTIGGVQDYYKGYISIPCSIQNVAGLQHYKSLILVSKQPPFRWHEQQKIYWAQDIDTVSPSPFALPIDVRRASSEKKEEAMGFAPVSVLDKKGTEYTLGCESQFFDHNGIKGEEIRLSGHQKKLKKLSGRNRYKRFTLSTGMINAKNYLYRMLEHSLPSFLSATLFSEKGVLVLFTMLILSLSKERISTCSVKNITAQKEAPQAQQAGLLRHIHLA
jgi:hypothetical protein